MPLPAKPSTKDIVVSYKNNEFNLSNLPTAIKQIAISKTKDFLHSSWQTIEDLQDILKGYTSTDKLYLKLRTNDGAVSDTIVYNTPTTTTPTLLQDGDTVKTPSSPDIYVIKTINNKKYKRLILSPNIFNSYQHLNWNSIKTITEEQLNQYQTSNLVKETTDTILYCANAAYNTLYRCVQSE